MKHIVLPDNRRRRLVFYLAMEEYVARYLDEKEAFFMWQVEPTVIFGRHQVMEAEVNVDYCKEHNIQIYRRKSGGGCVYSDTGNIMISYIRDGEAVGFIFDSYLRRISFLLQQIGIDAQVSGRNDILVDGKKVSGNAFYQMPGRSIVHGTMLFDTCFDHLEKAITPSDNKLSSKGVQSVRQRVTNLSQYTDMGVESFKQYIIDNLCDGERVLTSSEIAAIEKIESTYLDPSFLYGKDARSTYNRLQKSDKAGLIDIEITLRHRAIEHITLKGDFFVLRDFDNILNTLLKGKKFTQGEIQAALSKFDLSQYIRDLSTDELIKIIFTKN